MTWNYTQQPPPTISTPPQTLGYALHEETLPTLPRYVLITLNVFVSICGVLGNILIIFFFSRGSKKRSNDSLYRYKKKLFFSNPLNNLLLSYECLSRVKPLQFLFIYSFIYLFIYLFICLFTYFGYKYFASTSSIFPRIRRPST